MSIYKAWTVYLFVYWGYCTGTSSVRFNATVLQDKHKNECCDWVENPLPRYMVIGVLDHERDRCGREIVFFLSSGHAVCVPAKGWARDLACHIKNEEASYDRISSMFSQVADILRLQQHVPNGALAHGLIDADLDDFMYVASDVYLSPRVQSRRYEYRVWDGSSWVQCYCDLKLRMTSKFFPGGVGPDKPKATIESTLEITFSAASGDLFTRCTHNHVYREDAFFASPVINRQFLR